MRSRLSILIPVAFQLCGQVGEIEISLGKPIEKELAGMGSHSYRFTISAGQFVRLITNQQGIDVVLRLAGPDGKTLVEMDSPNGNAGFESIYWLATAPGTYVVEVKSTEKTAPAGRYRLVLDTLRPVEPRDRDCISAQSAFLEATRLKGQPAIDKYEEALGLWTSCGDREREATVLDSIGSLRSATRQWKNAANAFARAANLHREAGNRRAEMKARRQLSNVYDALGEKDKALESLRQALAIARDSGDRRSEASLLSDIASLLDSRGEDASAREHYELSLAVSRDGGDRTGEFTALHNMGSHFDSVGDRAKALELFEQALAIERAMGDRKSEAITLHQIANMHEYLGERQKAFDTNRQALDLHRALGNQAGEAITLLDLGALYYHVDENDKALDYYQQALAKFRAIGSRSAAARALFNIGELHRYRLEREKALASFQEVLNLSRAAQNRILEGEVLASIGALQCSMGNKEQAERSFGDALVIQRSMRDTQREASTLCKAGRCLASEPDGRRQALESFSRALPLFREISYKPGELVALQGMALAERDLGLWKEARDHAAQLLAIVEATRTQVTSPELRASYLGSKQRQYEFYIDLLMQSHRHEPAGGFDRQALEVSERARARSLVDVLTEGGIDIREGVDRDLVKKDATLHRLLASKADRYSQLLRKEGAARQAETMAKEIANISAEHVQVEARIRASSPHYMALVQPVPLAAKEIQAQIRDTDTLLLEYSLGQERSYLWVVSGLAINSYELPPRDTIETAARRVYEFLKREEFDEKSYEKESAALVRTLLGPAVAQLGSKRLVVVADGALQYIPFGALPDPVRKATPLVATHEIVNIPSATALAVLRKESAERRPAPKLVAVLADPVFETNDPRLASTPENSQSRPAAPGSRDAILDVRRLPYTRQEAATIVRLVPAGMSRQALDFEANRETATGAELSQFRILHYATHAFVNSQQPELSGIVLSLLDRQARPRDGFLRLIDLYNLRLNADLVVLSACQTALGKEIKGEGLIGLSRGFFYAGAPRVVASLWKVDDRATTELMRVFYQGMLAQHSSPATALRAAQIAMWKQNRWRSPYFWGAFVLQGEWR